MKMMKDRFCGEHARITGRTSAAVMFLILAVIIMSIGSQSVFADDTTSGGSTVAASIKCGEHGTVNEKTGEFTETVASGGNLHLEFAADEGYVIGSILINEEQLDDDDMDGIAGATSGVLDLEGLEDTLSVQVIFMTTEEYANQPTTGGEDNNPGNEGGTDDTGSEGGNTGGQEQTDPGNNGGDDLSDPDNGDEITDPQNPDDGNEADDPSIEDPSEIDDGTGDGTDSSYDPDYDGTYDQGGTTGDTDSNYDDEDSDNEYSDEEGTSDDDQLSEQEASDDSIEEQTDTKDETAEETTSGTDTVSGSNDTKTSSAISKESDSDDDEDDASKGKGDYYDTPKTGDDRLVLPLSLTIMGLALIGIAAIIARRRATE